MKLVFTHYLAGLKERGELDVIMPDLLSELGLNVISKPARGTKQYGVDVAAVGALSGGVRSLFLLSIKPGNLTRCEWNTGPQALRPSLDQILDVYIQSLKPKRYEELPVVVVLCLGGELHEAVRHDVEGYMARNTRGDVRLELWNGDRLAELLLSGVLRERALPPMGRSDLRKAVAFVDEPDVGFRHFCRFLDTLADRCRSTRPARLTALRQIHVALWTVHVWAREAENLEAPYLCSERAMLLAWSLVRTHFSGNSKHARQLAQSMERLISLHNAIAERYIADCVAPRAATLHGLASAVPGQVSLDINLRLFDVLGRVAAHGLWKVHRHRQLSLAGKADHAEEIRRQLHDTAMLIADMVRHNPVLRTPVKDDQAIDINIACLFLNRVGCNEAIRDWVEQTAIATVFAYDAETAYPCIFRDYRDLAAHPRDEPDYRRKATAGSILVPTLAVWAALCGDTRTLGLFAGFADGPYRHSTLQLWYAGPDSEEHLYRGDANHGLAAAHIRIARACEDMLAPIRSECTRSAAYSSLSAVTNGLSPLVVSASRHHRIPLPPHLWPL